MELIEAETILRRMRDEEGMMAVNPVHQPELTHSHHQRSEALALILKILADL
jgi:hypothetical protein